MELDADVLHLQVSGEVTQLNASAMLYRIAELCAGRTYSLLLQLQGVRQVGHATRRVLAAGPWPVRRCAVVATCPVDWTIAYFYLGRHPPTCSARLFRSTPEAMDWLCGPTGL